MADEELESEVSLDVALSEYGVKATVKARLINALDYVGASYVLNKFKSKAGRTREDAAIGDARVAMVKAFEEAAVGRIKTDPDLAKLFIQSQLGTMLHREENKAAAVERAIDDLASVPPLENEGLEGPEAVAPETLNRWTRYAEDASTEELRDRWGKVLAQEIRAPGTFPRHVMRIVDELEPDIAQKFEQICKYEMGGAIASALIDPLNFEDQSRLVESGLIFDPGVFGQILNMSRRKASDGEDFYFAEMGLVGLAISADASLNSWSRDERPYLRHNTGASMSLSVYALTAAGKAIASIIAKDQFSAVLELRSKLQPLLSSGQINVFKAVGSNFRKIQLPDGT